MARTIGPIRPSESTQVAVIVEATIAGAPVEVAGEYTTPAGPGGAGSWQFGWRWALGDATLADLLKKLFPSLEAVPGLQDIKPGAVAVAYVSGAASRGLSFEIGDLSFVYLKDKAAATCWGLVHE